MKFTRQDVYNMRPDKTNRIFKFAIMFMVFFILVTPLATNYYHNNKASTLKFKDAKNGTDDSEAVSVKNTPVKEVIPCGGLVGIRVESDGICVVGTSDFETEEGKQDPSADRIQKGDTIHLVNGKEVHTKEELKQLVESGDGEVMTLSIHRNQETKEVEIYPEYSVEEGEYKLGLWVKDGAQGIGTLTYIDPDTSTFGALGHGITDSDLKKLMPVKEGEITQAAITSITKGQRGAPGEMSGIIEYHDNTIIGNIVQNTPLGIYGSLNDNGTKILQGKKIPIAYQDEIHEGEATILSSLTGKDIREYDVIVQKVSKYSSEPSKGMVIKIVDPELLEQTNGIIQGMSGSPIIQDDKIIGAITHVFIQDPTKGYGIFIENMINNDTK